MKGSSIGSRVRVIQSRVAWFVTRDEGDDLIEYALLTAFVGTAGALLFNVLSGAIFSSYTSWDAGQQTISATTPNPGS